MKRTFGFEHLNPVIPSSLNPSTSARKLELPATCPPEARSPDPGRSFWVREEKPRYGAAPHWSSGWRDSRKWSVFHPLSPDGNPPPPGVEPDPGASRRNRFTKNVSRTRRLPRKFAIGLQNKGNRLFEVFLHLRERGALGVGPRQLLHPTHVALRNLLLNSRPIHGVLLIPERGASNILPPSPFHQTLPESQRWRAGDRRPDMGDR